GRAAAEWFLRLRPEERPDAVFAVNDLVALGMLHRIVADGSFRVPEDLAIVGFNDTESEEYAVIPLTSVRVSQEEIGQTALRMLLDVIADHATPVRHRRLQPELIVRSSTVPHPNSR
ncbi:MAG: substrate-binding domain-containing protein, partial [Rhodoglobus sp.]|nr:substrate-binding domain-containing protein [Rhodoglobus sp.]